MQYSHDVRSQFIDLEAMLDKSESPLSIKECLTKFNETNVGNTTIVVSHIHSIWDDIVGSDISSHVKVLHIKNSILHLSVDNPAWITQLKYMQDSIIEQINQQNIPEKITRISAQVFA